MFCLLKVGGGWLNKRENKNNIERIDTRKKITKNKKKGIQMNVNNKRQKQLEWEENQLVAEWEQSAALERKANYYKFILSIVALGLGTLGLFYTAIAIKKIVGVWFAL